MLEPKSPWSKTVDICIYRGRKIPNPHHTLSIAHINNNDS
jgi:hypothetical protein